MSLIVYTLNLGKAFATRRALNLLIDPSARRCILKTHLFPIDLRWGQRSTYSRTLFLAIESTSSFVASIYSLWFGESTPCWKEVGSYTFRRVHRKTSSSIWKYRRGILPRSLLRILGPSLFVYLVGEFLPLSLRGVRTLACGETLHYPFEA